MVNRSNWLVVVAVALSLFGLFAYGFGKAFLTPAAPKVAVGDLATVHGEPAAE